MYWNPVPYDPFRYPTWPLVSRLPCGVCELNEVKSLTTATVTVPPLAADEVLVLPDVVQADSASAATPATATALTAYLTLLPLMCNVPPVRSVRRARRARVPVPRGIRMTLGITGSDCKIAGQNVT